MNTTTLNQWIKLRSDLGADRLLRAGAKTPTTMDTDESDPRNCERCGDPIVNGNACEPVGEYLFLCPRCKRKVTRPATPKTFKFNPYIEKL